MKQPVGFATSDDETLDIYAFLDSDGDELDPETLDPQDVAFLVVRIDEGYQVIQLAPGSKEVTCLH